MNKVEHVLLSEVQCIKGNGHTEHPPRPPGGQTDTTETLPSINFAGEREK